MNMTLNYLFDPLCGWCYGASPVLTELRDIPGIKLELMPTGLFSGTGARPMNDEFAAYAWENDQRISNTTGQPFSRIYCEKVLQDRQKKFDSGSATLAITAVSLSYPTRELDALKAIQHARYVEGLDVTSLSVLAGVLSSLGLENAAKKVLAPAADLLEANHTRTERAKRLMREFGARGVPTFISESGSKRWMLNSSMLFSNPHQWIRQLVDS
ncbi:DsbA family protein [Dickeya dianthicola]|uniref:DsbA family protein n=2 Tax=Gammaproteobacteria TaxID=1236 RepID=A0ABX9NNH3_9GAMM|nr:DsbA family protein [Dickeya dianthicola]MCL6386563.1 DsbA family protein [Pectobacterium carotovorum subsp. carotovorum]PWD65031.1 protein-disulfide isomerase [Pectobacterium versatile]QLJ45913.1 DsbA family protein [Raoultella ornithinolytica]MBI0449206.1 DsbA family protein [Dickeya dianthicola]